MELVIPLLIQRPANSQGIEPETACNLRYSRLQAVS